MTTKLILDNWLLQEIAQILNEGLSPRTAYKINVDYHCNSHSFTEIPHAAIQIESLMNFLTDIVTRDYLITDKGFSHTWLGKNSALMKLKDDEQILTLKKFETGDEEFLLVRESALKDLCATKSIKEVQQLNEERWAKERLAADGYMSQVVWGTAGYLARSYIYQAPYSPHPSRSALIEQTTFMPSRPDAIADTKFFIESERYSLYQGTREGLSYRTAQVVLPPFIVEIIESSNTVEDLVPVALQMRRKYTGFRDYMSKYQQEMDDGNGIAIIKHREILEEVHSKINTNKTIDYGAFSLSLGVAFLNLNVPLAGTEWLKTKFGIRATLQRLIIENKGESSLQKLIKMFGEKNPKIIFDVTNYFRAKQRKS